MPGREILVAYKTNNNVNSNSSPTQTIYDQITVYDIKNRSIRNNQIRGGENNSNMFEVKSIIIYKTNDNRYGKLQITDYAPTLKLRWTTYNSNGSIYSEGSNIRLENNQGFDLDRGIVTWQESVDIVWNIENSRERYIDSKGGSKINIW